MKEKINLKNKCTINNSLELATKLTNIQITKETKMASYDITNLYTGIPIKDTIEIIKTELNTNTEEHAHTEQLTKAIETILNQTYFRFNNKIYKQEDGIPMAERRETE